jgi:Ran GTPase-activating protein (RanGAP) involved in mRNA processing and transport
VRNLKIILHQMNQHQSCSIHLDGNTALEKLALSDNNVGDRGVHFLAKILSLNNCSLWQINRNHISDRGIEVLTSVLIHHNSTLQRIDLDENKLMSDASVDIFVAILKFNCSLSILDICNCNLSENGKERLR